MQKNETLSSTLGIVHSGAVLPDEVHVLQFSYRCLRAEFVRAVCGRRVPRDSGMRLARRLRGDGCRYDLSWRRDAQFARAQRLGEDSGRDARDLCLRMAGSDAGGRSGNDHAGESRAWREAGVNRISMGAQSFCDEELAAAGRMHRREDIYQRRMNFCVAPGFANISLDLIAGLPHQTRASWERIAWTSCWDSAGARFDLFAGSG